MIESYMLKVSSFAIMLNNYIEHHRKRQHIVSHNLFVEDYIILENT